MARVGVLSDLAVKHRSGILSTRYRWAGINASYTFTKKYI
jgi:hypothetical protein